MESLVCIRPGLFQYQEGILPVLKASYAILRIRRIGICGTDLHAFEGTQPFFEYPRILGHELAAELVEADGLDDLQPGHRVTVLPYLNCGRCIACRSGKSNCCVSLKVLGVHVDGGMAEFIAVPSSKVIHADGMQLDDLAMVEPLAIGRHAVVRAGLRQGEWVLVMGGGPIGMGIIAYAGIAGARVIAMDRRPDRLKACRAISGASEVIDGSQGDVLSQLMEITSGDMPACVFDATGNLEAIRSGFEWMAHGGKYILVGLQKNMIAFSHPSFHKREGSLFSSRNALKEDFEAVIDSIIQKKIDASRYITHRLSFSTLGKEFANLFDPENDLIKAMVELP